MFVVSEVIAKPLAIGLAACALAVSGCAGSVRGAAQPTVPAKTPGSRSAVEQTIGVPDLVGKTLREATCTITAAHLRWTLTGPRYATSGPLSGCGSQGVASSLDDIRVLGQTPAAGASVAPGTVIALRTICTTSHPCA